MRISTTTTTRKNDGNEKADDRMLVRSLHPLLLFDVETSEVFFLNGKKGKKKANYLCYTSGNVVDREGLGKTQQQLLSRVLRITVDESDVKAWTEEVAEDDPETDLEQADGDAKYLDEFQLISLIGRGGMGEVYRAWQPSLGRECGVESFDARQVTKIRKLVSLARFARWEKSSIRIW